MLKRGSSGKKVKELQRNLNRLGYRLKVDGIFGEKTEKAVKSFQRKYKLRVDGIVGVQTEKALKTLLSPKPKPSLNLRKLIVLDVQHLGKRSRPSDRGAVFKGLSEAEFNYHLAEDLKEALIKKGFNVRVLVMDVGKAMDYPERHEWVNKRNVSLYLALHLNSARLLPKTFFSLFEFDYKNSVSERVAQIFASKFSKNFKRPSYVKKLYPLMRGRVCIKGIKPTTLAVLCEPFFIQEIALLKGKYALIRETFVEACVEALK